MGIFVLVAADGINHGTFSRLNTNLPSGVITVYTGLVLMCCNTELSQPGRSGRSLVGRLSNQRTNEIVCNKSWLISSWLVGCKALGHFTGYYKLSQSPRVVYQRRSSIELPSEFLCRPARLAAALSPRPGHWITTVFHTLTTTRSTALLTCSAHPTLCIHPHQKCSKFRLWYWNIE